MICVQFEIVVYITNRFFLFAHNSFLEETSPEEKLGLLRTISEIIGNDSVLFCSLNWNWITSYVLSVIWWTSILTWIALYCGIFSRSIYWIYIPTSKLRFTKQCKNIQTNPLTLPILLVHVLCFEFIVVFFIPFSMSKKVGSMWMWMWRKVCIRTRSLFTYIVPISSRYEDHEKKDLRQLLKYSYDCLDSFIILYLVRKSVLHCQGRYYHELLHFSTKHYLNFYMYFHIKIEFNIHSAIP